MADSSKRTLVVWEAAPDRKYLGDDGLYLQVAKSVVKNGTLVYNTIWQSRGVAPNTSISWDAIYGLNWIAGIPAEGLTVNLQGEWQQCGKGEVYDLDAYGGWTSSTAKPSPGFLKVGHVGYSYAGLDGINIVVGVQNGSGGFDPIFVDPISLNPNSSAKYQPAEEVKIWYEGGQKTATMISEDFTHSANIDFTSPSKQYLKFYYSANYQSKSGTWTISPDTPAGTFFP